MSPTFDGSTEVTCHGDLSEGDISFLPTTVYPKKYAHGFVVLCFIVVMQSFIMNSREVLIHIHQGCFAGTGAIVRLPQCQWSKPDGYGKISQCITTTKHSKAKTACIFLGIYCTPRPNAATPPLYSVHITCSHWLSNKCKASTPMQPITCRAQTVSDMGHHPWITF